MSKGIDGGSWRDGAVGDDKESEEFCTSDKAENLTARQGPECVPTPDVVANGAKDSGRRRLARMRSSTGRRQGKRRKERKKEVSPRMANRRCLWAATQVQV